MGFLFNDVNEIREKVKENFLNTKDYLVTMKYNDIERSILQLVICRLFYIFDSARTFVLNFDEKGVYELEISNGVKGKFVLIPWHEISNLELYYKNNKAIITFFHIGKKLSYEIYFDRKIFNDNYKNLENLKSKNFYRI